MFVAILRRFLERVKVDRVGFKPTPTGAVVFNEVDPAPLWLKYWFPNKLIQVDFLIDKLNM